MAVFRISITNNTSSNGGWTSGSSADSTINAGNKVVRYFDVYGTSHAVGVNNDDALVIANFAVADVCTGSVISTKAQITEGFHVKLDALVGDREITLFDHVGTA